MKYLIRVSDAESGAVVYQEVLDYLPHQVMMGTGMDGRSYEYSVVRLEENTTDDRSKEG